MGRVGTTPEELIWLHGCSQASQSGTMTDGADVCDISFWGGLHNSLLDI